MEMLSTIFLLFVLLFVFSALGHGLWLVMAATARGIQGALGSGKGDETRPSSGDTNPKIQQDIQAARRLIGYARFQNWLTPTQLQTLDRLLDQLTRRTSGLDTQEVASPVSAPDREPSASTTSVLSASNADSSGTPVVQQQLAPKTLPAAVSRPPEPRPWNSSWNQPPAPLIEPEPIAAAIQAPSSIVAAESSTPQSATLRADLLRSFMQQSNIRWIELISATLIIVCSVGLVISLWNTLASTSRYLPSLVFLLATLAVHAAGHYTLRKWKLRNTSRGILHIGLTLIPLAVLVGILLSQRPNQPAALDTSTWLVLVVGCITYGASALLTCRALFGSRYLLITATLILCAATLLPIHYLGSNQLLNRWQSTICFLPMIVLQLASSLRLSLSSRVSKYLSSRRMRRIAGQVVQLVFAALVPCVYCLLKFTGLSNLNPTMLSAFGLLLAAWSAWGWSASVSSWSALNTTFEKTKTNVNVSWYSMLTWSSASLCSLAVLTILWNVSADRVLLTSLLTALACWWLCHGWSNRLHVTLLAGWVCALIAVGLSIEPTLFATRPLLNSTDWFTLPRIGSISLTCLLAGGLILLLKRSAWRQGPPADKHTILGWSAPDASQLLSMGLVASGVGLVGSMGLTVLASLVPWSQPAYGGNWAPILLIIFGTATLSAGLLLPKWLPSPTEQSLQPQSGRSLTKGSLTAFNGATISTTAVLVAQLVLLLGVVRFCQTGIAIPDWLASLRPWRSWAIGTGILALIWSGLAGCLRWSWKTTDQPGEWFYQSHARLLCIGAIGLAWLTGLAWWTHMDHWTMASRLGWQIPVTWMLSFCALRRTNWRELSILSLLVWLATCLIVYGNSNLWWTRLGVSASCGLIVFVLLAALATYELAILCLPNKFHWIGGGPRWAEGAALHGLWPVYILFLAIASTIILGTSLTDASAQFSQDGFWLPQVTWLRSAISLLALSSLTAFTLWWNAQRSSSVVGWLITVPIGLAGIVSCHALVPYPIPVFLWLLAAYVIVSEVLLASKIHMLLLRVVRRGNQPSISQAAVEQAIRSHATERSWFHRTWLASLGTIIATTALLWVYHWIGGLPDVLSPQVAQPSSWTDLMQNFLCLWLWSGPVLTVFLSQWIAALTRAQSHRKISSWGWAFAVWFAWMVTCAYSDRSEAFLLLLARGCCLTLSATAMLTLGFTCLRNWLGLRALAPQSPTLQLISKACKGARWRQAESATWNLWTGAMVAASVLSISAVVAIAFYPQTQSSLLHLLGSGWTFLGLLGTLCVLRILGRQSDWSGFGLVAISLGLLAPIAAASYGSWLWDNPASRFALANNHEPYRLLIGLWLTALISGLCLRMKAVWQTKQLSPSGDWAWITLASVVGLMAMIGLWSDLLWSTIELSILAGIIAISSEVSKQTWRGYVAAMISCIAYLPWLADTSANLRFGSLWQMMAALVGVGLLTMVTRLVFRKKISKSVERDTTGQITIDRIVCLTVAVACCAMSGIWILLQPDTVSAEWTTTVVILGLTVSNLLLAVLRLWDSGPSERGLSLYFAMIALVLVIANSLAAFQQWPRWQSELAWFFGLLSVLAVIGLLTRRLLSAPDRWLRWMPGSLFIDQERLRRNCDQMLQFHLICGLLSLPPSLWLALFIPEQPWRTAASLLPMLGALATVSIALDQKLRWVRSSVLLMSSVTLVLLAWIDLPSAWSVRNQPQSWHFGHRLFLAFTALSVAYPLIAWRRLGDSFWAKTLVQGGWILTGLSMLTGSGLVLGSVFEAWDRYPASIGFMPKLITLVAWILTIAKLLQLAIEPMGLDKRLKATWRYASVYAAELSLVAASASIYQHFPEFFSGQFVQWWPLAVFGIAVLSVAVGWWAQRTDLPFLADPIQRSSLLLPLIPLVAVWWTPMSQSGWQWSDWHSYCWLLIMAAGLYGLHGWTRQSSRWLAVSVGLAQLSYWSFLHSTPNLRFYEHPQFWLLPPALGGLAFVEWHRKQLAPSVVTTMRYVTVLLAYLSSSTEVFFKAFEGNLWQPLWLLMLALLGVAAGMFLQVRAFLYCGVTFVLVALVGMVRQAAQAIDQVWPWWAFGIATGILLIVALGYLEKNRSQVLGYLEKLKRWQQ